MTPEQTEEYILSYINNPKKPNKIVAFGENNYRPNPNCILAWEIYHIDTNPNEQETISCLNNLVKKGLLEIRITTGSIVWYDKVVK